MVGYQWLNIQRLTASDQTCCLVTVVIPRVMHIIKSWWWSDSQNWMHNHLQ